MLVPTGEPSFGLNAKQNEAVARLRLLNGGADGAILPRKRRKVIHGSQPAAAGAVSNVKYAKTDLLQSAFFVHPSFMFVTPPGVGEVYYEALNAGLLTNKELAVSDQQWTKLYAVFQSQTVQELYRFHEQVFTELTETARNQGRLKRNPKRKRNHQKQITRRSRRRGVLLKRELERWQSALSALR